MINSNYDSLTDAKRAQLISSLYIDKKLSFINISKQYQTYPNRLRRDAIRFNIPIRSKSEAQKNALETGSHLHPTKGTVRSTKVKDKIGLGVMKNWESMDPATLKDRKIKSKEMWDALSDSDKQNMLHLANLAVRESSKVGSKIEKFNLQLKHFPQGYEFNHHEKEHIFYLLSFAHINLQNSLVQFNFNDILSLEEIKQITKYEIIKN